MSDNNVYLNGQIVPEASATISISDAGFLHGASTFTTMMARNGVVFRLDRHLERLMETVKLLGLRTDATADSLTNSVYELLAANGLSNARLRVTLTPGSVHEGGPTTLITAQPLPEYPAAWYEKGIGVVVSSLKQCPGDPTFGYKTGCYLPRVLGRQEAAAKGADEALWFTHDNRLAEACFCNVFLVLGGEVYTPPADTPALPGIVRQAVLELCDELAIPCHSDIPLTVKEMLGAQEVFLTGSTTGIRPVTRIERHSVAEEKPGPVTKRLIEAYRQLVERECSGR